MSNKRINGWTNIDMLSLFCRFSQNAFMFNVCQQFRIKPQFLRSRDGDAACLDGSPASGGSMRLARLCFLLVIVGLAASGCGATGVFTIDGNGKISPFNAPPHISVVESTAPLERAEESYRFLMTRCSGAEAEAYARSRRLFGTRLFLQLLTASFASAATLMISIDEIHDGGALSLDTRENLKISAAVFGSAAVVATSALAFSSVESQLEVSRRLLQQVRRTRDNVRARWWHPQSDKAALLMDLAQTCGGVPIEERSTRPSALPAVEGSSSAGGPSEASKPADPASARGPTAEGNGPASTSKPTEHSAATTHSTTEHAPTTESKPTEHSAAAPHSPTEHAPATESKPTEHPAATAHSPTEHAPATESKPTDHPTATTHPRAKRGSNRTH